MKYILIVVITCISTFAFAKKKPASYIANNPNSESAVNCTPSTAMVELNINNVRTTMLAGGDMWSDLSNAKYEIPMGSGKHSMFAGSLWIGGIDAGGQVRVAAQTYRQIGNDFWPGPLDTTTTNIVSARCQHYNTHWKISRQEVLNFVSNGTTSLAITNWPGNGNSLYNEAQFLAPFFDNNGDGIYNHNDGDYPGYSLSNSFLNIPGTTVPICNDYLMGDQSIWWVINDVGNTHTETGSAPIGIEIRCQAFAFQSNTPAINNSTFYKYQVINRSSTTYTETYFAQWADPDVGNYIDDYVGCDVIQGLGYCYNDWDDETASGYGLNPPAIGIDFLSGPKADIGDAIDNDLDGCIDCTYMDSLGLTIVIPDLDYPEPISMSKFVYYNNSSNPATGNPNGFNNYYKYLRGVWLDNQPITYGSDGRNPANPVCNYMFPDNTDPDFPVSWTEMMVGPPGDKRFLMSAGPFTLEPGEVNYITTAVVWARATSGGPLASVALLRQQDSQVQQLFQNCFRVLGTSVNDVSDEVNVNVFPNPATEYINFNLTNYDNSCELKVFNAKGKLLLNTKIEERRNFKLDTENFAKGIYFYELSNQGKNVKSGKIIVQ